MESLEAGNRVGDDYLNAGDVLDPTLSKQLEAGAKFDSARWSGNLAAFRLERGANIDRLTDAGRVLVQDGITLYEGIEASADLRVTDALVVGGGATWLDPTYDKLSPDSANQQGNRPAGAAHWSGVLHATWQLPWVDGLEAYAVGRYYGDVWYDADNTLKLPDYTLFNAGVGYRTQAAGHAVTWRGSVENLGNRRYWSNAGIGLPRTIAVSVRLDL